MNYRPILLLKLLMVMLASTLLSACSTVVKKEAPTISHVHIGHAITGWPLTPKKQGLLVVAELSSLAAATNSELMLKAARDGNLEKARRYLRETARAVDPGFLDEDSKNEYGLRKAAAEAITHLQLASEVEDASANVQRTVTTTQIKAKNLLDQSDELLAYLDAGNRAQNVAEMQVIAEEIVHTLVSIVGGPDITDTYGLYNFREDIEAMVRRENPPYRTVDNYYLFNMVKLPNGKWGFSSRDSQGSSHTGH